MALDYLQQLYSYTTLSEGKNIINENFNGLVDFLNELTSEEIGRLLEEGLISVDLLDAKAEHPPAGQFVEGNVVEFDGAGDLVDSGFAADSVAVVSEGTGRIPAGVWVEPSLTRLFVDVNRGDDSFAGTDVAHPFKSIKAAVGEARAMLEAAAQAEPGDENEFVTGVTIHVAAGDYVEDNPIVLPSRVSVVGDDLRNVRLFAENPSLDYFHVKSLNYLAHLRFMQLRRPAFCVAFPSAILDSSLVVGGSSLESISVLYSPEGYVGVPDVVIDPPDEEGGVQAEASVVVEGGVITGVVLDNPGSGYLRRPHISVAAPEVEQPIVVGSTYVQNCSSITGPFDVEGKQISPLAPLPYDFENGFSYIDFFTGDEISYGPVDEEGAGGGMRIDGRVVFGYNNLTENSGFESPLRSMVADAFTQVNQGGPGHLVTNIGYAQFVSCFTTFCTYSFKAKNGGFANISNSVTDFGNEGLIAEGYEKEPYTVGNAVDNLRSTVGAVNIVNGGSGYDDENPPSIVISGGGGTGALASAVVEDGIVVRAEILNPGVNYDSKPNVFIDSPPSGGTQASAEVFLNAINEVEVRDLTQDSSGNVRRPDVGSAIWFGDENYSSGQWGIVNNVVEEPSGNFVVSFRPSVESINQAEVLRFNQRSNLSTGSHVFEYGGSGVTYNALPEYGGIPNPEKEVRFSEPAQVFYTSNDNLGNLRIGEFFAVEQATGAVTINTDIFNLSGLNAIGPFRVNGIPYGVVLRELTNKPSLLADSGLNDNAAATVSAIRTYISNRTLREFSDVSYPSVAGGGVDDGQFFRWNASSAQWEPQSVMLNELVDIDLDVVTPQAGYALVYGTSGDWRAGIPEASQSLDNGAGRVLTTDEVYDHINTESNPHGVTPGLIGAVPSSDVGNPDGVAPLNTEGIISEEYLPPLSLGSVEVVSNITERDSLSPVVEGDIARVLDSDGLGNPVTYIYDSDDGWVIFDSQQQVTSVNSMVGDVYLTTSNIDEGTNEYYTQQKVESVIDSKVDADFVNAFNLSAQELKDSADETLIVDAAEVYKHVNNVWDETFIPDSGPDEGKNPHGITPELIGAYPDDTTTDGIPEGDNNEYYTDVKVQNVVTKDYVDALSVNAGELNNVVASQFLRSDENDEFSGTILGNKLDLGVEPLVEDESARLEINGYMRSGSIFLHAEGQTIEEPRSQAKRLRNIDGSLQWEAATVWTSLNDGPGSGLNADFLDNFDSSGLLDRENHTGQQSVDTLSDFDDAISNVITNFTSNPVNFTNDIVIDGELTVSGGTTFINTQQLAVEDAVITLNTGQVTPFNDAGFVIQRYAAPTISDYNVALVWSESAQEFRFGATSEQGADNDIGFDGDLPNLNLDGGIFATISNQGTINATDIQRNGVSAVTSNDVSQIVRVTQDEYDALTPIPGVMYVVIG